MERTGGPLKAMVATAARTVIQGLSGDICMYVCVCMYIHTCIMSKYYRMLLWIVRGEAAISSHYPPLDDLFFSIVYNKKILSARRALEITNPLPFPSLVLIFPLGLFSHLLLLPPDPWVPVLPRRLSALHQPFLAQW